ncbi:MAG: ABC transporter ATP-binding protein [Pseudanabaenaceae cyanobacterium SKYGB_i_bin29]|nr:ABC transporter ATP-binding protein/permease [Pseudanabaenaceae cyanobacterium SKYG29]MDW8422443.1 ABC transporter ATP-binding protein [Pseudanabaenaceae cyanobacterium SKYGB_i_bin29]
MASFKDIISYYKSYRGIALFSIVASCLFEVIDLVVPYAIGQILNVLSQQPVDPLVNNLVRQVEGWFTTDQRSLTLGVLLFITFLATVVRAPIQPWVSSWFHWLIALSARREQTDRTIAKILSLPLEFYEENNPGRIAGRVARGLSNHTWSYPDIAGQLIPKLARVTAIFLMILAVAPGIAILFLGLFVFILQFSVRDLYKLISKEELLEKHQENTESRTSEIITNIKTVKAFANEGREWKRQHDRLKRELKSIIHGIHLGYVVLGTKQRTLVQAGVFIVLVLTLRATLAGQITLGQFITTLTISSMAYSELEPISTFMEIFARRYASMIRFHEFMQLPVGKDSPNIFAQPVPYKFAGKIEFRNVGFSYDGIRLVLEDINFTIEPYQTVALVGKSGSGKSTIVKLLLRYFSPTTGKILLDGEPIENFEILGYRKRLAIVHQEVDVFNGTLLENLVYGNPQASLEEVKRACAIAKVDDFLPLLPQGLYTIVGERGLRLSGGQRQRLGIARALLVNPDVLIFDEATSSLDYESERAIQLAMRQIQGTVTTIIIAHRLSTVREADQILVLDRGRIVERGTHWELLKQQGLYYRLNQIQEVITH